VDAIVFSELEVGTPARKPRSRERAFQFWILLPLDHDITSFLIPITKVDIFHLAVTLATQIHHFLVVTC
jgi:hypothetical protein